MKKSLSWSLCILVYMATPGLAQQTGKDALDEWIKSSAESGTEATYRSAEESGDVLTVEDLAFSLTSSIALGGAKDGDTPSAVKLDFTWKIPELVAKNLSADDSGFSAERLEYPDDVSFNFVVGADDGVVLSYEGTIKDYVIEGIFWPRYPKIPDTLLGSTKEWLALLSSFAEVQIDKAGAGTIELDLATMEKPDEDGAVSVHTVIEGFDLQGMWDGRIAEYNTGEFRQETNYGSVDGQPYTELVTVEKTQAKNVDYAAMLVLFEPKPVGTSEYFEVIESTSMTGYRVESNFFEVLIDRIAYENFAVRSPETDLIAFIDRLSTGVEPDEGELLAMVLDVYRSFAIGRISMDGFLMGFDVDSETGSGGVGNVTISDLSSDGLGEFSIGSVDFDIGEQGSFRMDRFALGDLEFAPYGPMREFAKNTLAWDNPDPLEIARIFTPRSIFMELSGFAVASEELSGEVGLDNYFLRLSTLVPPVPTYIELSTEGLEFPVALMDDDEAEAIFKAAGIDVLRLTEKIKLHWDEDSEDLVIDELVVELGNVGQVRASGRLGGLPKAILQNPQQIEAAIATLNIKSAELELVNEGGVQTAITLMAKDAGVSEGLMVEALLMQLDDALTGIGNEAFRTTVMNAAREFFDKPDTLSVRLAPKRSAPVSLIISDLMMAPDMLPEHLGISVEANP
ncbi:hypothetical protein [Hoeflea sp. TYP-13]|uniref:hypothetical protein n=1 Tax=Hoeflea sp. TYP-13 TaxID=3230023 RepID=UPI0034C675E6